MIAHPAASLLSHGFTREDLFLAVFCVADDWMKARFGSANAPRQHRGPRADEFTDSELLAVLLVGELCHCQRERAWLRQVRASYRTLFPHLPDDSRFARRAERVRHLLHELRDTLLFWADADQEQLRILDSFPMPLCACYRIRQSSQPISGSTFGYNDSKRQFYFGLRPGLLITAAGFIVDLILAPANCNDTPLLAHYLHECIERGRADALAGQAWAMDKGFRNRALQQRAADELGLTLMPLQKVPKDEEPSFWQTTLNRLRKPIEGVISVLCECFGIEHLLVKTDYGIYRRTQAKATAFSLACYFNKVLSLPVLDIARYAV